RWLREVVGLCRLRGHASGFVEAIVLDPLPHGLVDLGLRLALELRDRHFERALLRIAAALLASCLALGILAAALRLLGAGDVCLGDQPRRSELRLEVQHRAESTRDSRGEPCGAPRRQGSKVSKLASRSSTRSMKIACAGTSLRRAVSASKNAARSTSGKLR